MRNLYTILLSVTLGLTLLSSQGSAQIHDGDWSIGLHGGVNYWANDLNQFKIGEGGNLILRYNISRYFSLGLMGGYDELKAEQKPVFRDLDMGITAGYMKASAMSGAMIGMLHFAPGRAVSPFIYAGGGGMLVKRKVGGALDLPQRGTFVVPVGFGVEAFVDKHTSISFDAGFKLFADWVDLRRNTSPDGTAMANAGINFYFGSDDADDDDNDMLSNAEERRLGTDPNVADTDHDGLKDGEEVRRYHTNPLKADTDGDGLSDGDEVLKYRTDPLKIDTDGDGLTDGDEVLKYHTDPLKFDTDGDGLSDGDEVLKYGTDPLRVDTDSDGLSDYDEVIIYHTNPLKPDTDGDGLIDGDEVKKYKTDPLKADTDGGGVNDGMEIRNHTNPLDPRDDQPGGGPMVLEKGSSVVLEGVTFPSGSARILPVSESILEKALAALRADPKVKVEIAGYTDNMGGALANDKLSKKRADAVKQWLVGQGIGGSRLTTVGKGPREPIAPNSTFEGRARNRRIEFHVK